jgi:ribosomal protein S18 acetylase RimI-like enzyme
VVFAPVFMFVHVGILLVLLKTVTTLSSGPLIPPRLATADDLPVIAALQLEAFDPAPSEQAAPSFLGSLFGSGGRSTRADRARRITAELEERVAKGSDLLVTGREGEPRLLGAVDLSEQEMLLPTHGLCEGLYLSGMAVDSAERRRGIGKLLLQAAGERAVSQGAEGIYLHVERSNAAAIALYKGCGYVKLALTPQLAGFTSALNLAHKEPLLLFKRLP